MSQSEVYIIIKDCGGLASQKQIQTIAKEKFPYLSLYSYIGNRLKKLEKSKIVTKIIDNNGDILWKIIDENFK